MSLPCTDVPIVSMVSVSGRGPESEGASGASPPQPAIRAIPAVNTESESNTFWTIITLTMGRLVTRGMLKTEQVLPTTIKHQVPPSPSTPESWPPQRHGLSSQSQVIEAKVSVGQEQ